MAYAALLWGILLTAAIWLNPVGWGFTDAGGGFVGPADCWGDREKPVACVDWKLCCGGCGGCCCWNCDWYWFGIDGTGGGGGAPVLKPCDG